MIPFRQEHYAGVAEAGPGRSLWQAVPRAYSIVLYSTDARFGWGLLILSLLVPWVGLAGLAGVLVSYCIGWWVGVDKDWLRSGFALFNPLLACSAVVLAGLGQGWTVGTMIVLWSAALLLSLSLTVGLQGWVGSRLGLSVQSVPAVMVVILLQWCGTATDARVDPVVIADWLEVDLGGMPDLAQAFFQAFSAMVFQPGVAAGIWVFTMLVLCSPLGGLMASVGFASGACALHLMGWPMTAGAMNWCGFNFILAGVALGAGYQIPNKSSLVLAVVGSVLTAVVAVGLSMVMGWFGLAPGALPYNLVVLSLMVALRGLPNPRGILRSPWSTLQPETVARTAQVNAVRFPDFHQAAIFLPWVGTRVVTQGFSGSQTHRGAWRHALDFEAPGGAGFWNASGGDLDEFSVFGTPVHAPVSGWVVAAENGVADNPVGHNNPERNWGNHVVIRADVGFHVMLAHFQHGTLSVVPGQRVEVGALLGNCGNSGRSPVPHLHVHVQQEALPGSSTRNFVLKHYIELDGASGREIYRLSGVPGQGSVLRSVNPSAGLHECFSGWLPGKMVYTDGGREETLEMGFDENGRFRLVSVDTGCMLNLFLSEGVLYASPFTGRGGGLVPLLGILLARVPCMNEPAVRWQDVVAATPFQGHFRRGVHDLLDPFAGVALLHYEYQFLECSDLGYEIVARLAEADIRHSSSAPRILRGRIEGRQGVVELASETCEGMKFRWVRNLRGAG